MARRAECGGKIGAVWGGEGGGGALEEERRDEVSLLFEVMGA